MLRRLGMIAASNMADDEQPNIVNIVLLVVGLTVFLYALFALGALYFFSNSTKYEENKSNKEDKKKNEKSKTPQNSFASLERTNVTEYTIEEIGKHNTVNDCWIIVDTFVYDLSTFVSDHPGEIEPLLKRSGPNQDATIGFRGSQHITTVEDQIKQYLIGCLKEYPLSEIAKHNKKDDCWIILNYKVYNVTEFIPSHPGGEAILRNAGKDSTEGFAKIGSHKKKAEPDDNYSNAELAMNKYLIGAVKKEDRASLKKNV